MEKKEWFVAYTVSKAEKLINTQIQELGIESYLPLQKVKRQWSDRVKLVEVPLFPSYLFVKTTKEKIPQLKSMRGIAWFIAFQNKLATIQEQEIELIRKVLAGGKEVIVTNNKFNSGQQVMIKEGPFAGLEGILIKEKGKNRFIMELKGLEQSISIDIPTNYLVENREKVISR